MSNTAIFDRFPNLLWQLDRNPIPIRPFLEAKARTDKLLAGRIAIMKTGRLPNTAPWCTKLGTKGPKILSEPDPPDGMHLVRSDG